MRRTRLAPPIAFWFCCILLVFQVFYTSAQDSSAHSSATGSGGNTPTRRPKRPKPVADVQPRIDINEISAMEDTNKYKIAMLLAWYEMTTSTDTTDPLGFWALAGVHGMRWTYNGQQPFGSEGFCRHSTSSFGPWHRPYLYKFEKGLQQAARRAVRKLRERKLRGQYYKVVKHLRLPYWDWTNPSTPRILTDSTVQVIDTSGRMIAISNPFLSYRYPQMIGGGRGQVISRGPNWAAALSSTATTQANAMRSLVASRNWECTYDGINGRGCPGNLEQTHNNIHNILGGTSGEMSTVEYAGYDPLFWIHHAMIDRVLWLCQNNGIGWLGTSSYIPFQDVTGNLADLRSLNYTYRDPLAGADLDFGFSSTNSHGNNNANNNNGNTWGSVARGRHRRKLLQEDQDALPLDMKVLDSGSEVGSPAAVAAVKRQLQLWARGFQGYTWQVEFRDLMKNLPGSNEAVNVHVFLQDHTATSSREYPKFPTSTKLDANQLRLRPDYCGSVAGFREVMERTRDKPHVASVGLTQCLRSAGVDVDVKPAQVDHAASGPANPAVHVSQLRLVALTASGLDVTEQFYFGEPVISWALTVPSAAAPQTGGLMTAGASGSSGSGGAGSYSLVQGSFE